MPSGGDRAVSQGNFLVVKDGTKEFRKGMPSCGPFRLTEFSAGQGSAFERYDDHYGHVPRLDGLELRSIAYSTARAGALTSRAIALGIAPSTPYR